MCQLNSTLPLSYVPRPIFDAFLFLLHLLIFSLFVCAWTTTCHGTSVEVRGQLAEARIFFHHVSFRAQTQVIGLGTKHFYPLIHLTSSRPCGLETQAGLELTVKTVIFNPVLLIRKVRQREVKSVPAV